MRLRDMQLSEIYVSANGEGDACGSHGMMRLGSEHGGELAEIAAILVSDLDRPERKIVHDGRAYRATRIDDDRDGYSWALRRAEVETRGLAELGHRPDTVRRIVEAAKARRSGLLLIAGGTNSGKTTTCASIMKTWLSAADGVGYMLESPPEMAVPKRIGRSLCFQVAVEEEGYEGVFGRAMRSNPRYIAIGEIRYEQAARLALRAALSGHLVVGTIHAGSPTQALMQVLNVGRHRDEEQAAALLADGFLGVVHQEKHHGPHGVRLETSSLFADGDKDADMIRAKIKSRQFGSLKNEVLSQSRR